MSEPEARGPEEHERARGPRSRLTRLLQAAHELGRRMAVGGQADLLLVEPHRRAPHLLDIGARPESQVWLAIYESGLSSRVTAGENSGKVLNHDFVVRELAGPFTVGADGSAHFEQSVHWAAEWNAQRTGVALFVERRDSGEIVQAAALPRLCGS